MEWNNGSSDSDLRPRPSPTKPFGRSELSKSVRTFAGGEAALLLDGDKGPLAIDDLPVEDVVADDENGRVLRSVVV